MSKNASEKDISDYGGATPTNPLEPSYKPEAEKGPIAKAWEFLLSVFGNPAVPVLEPGSNSSQSTVLPPTNFTYDPNWNSNNLTPDVTPEDIINWYAEQLGTNDLNFDKKSNKWTWERLDSNGETSTQSVTFDEMKNAYV